MRENTCVRLCIGKHMWVKWVCKVVCMVVVMDKTYMSINYQDRLSMDGPVVDEPDVVPGAVQAPQVSLTQSVTRNHLCRVVREM